MKKPTLIIIFNHRFDKNIPKLKEIYNERFSNICYLVPFYDGTDPSVYCVYENSYRYQGYIAQASEFLNKIDCSHYVFIGDDLILNPSINENNILEVLGVEDSSSGFIDEFLPLHKEGAWTRLRQWGLSFINDSNGSEGLKLLPKSEDLSKKLAQYGYSNVPLSYAECNDIPESFWASLKWRVKTIKDRRSPKSECNWLYKRLRGVAKYKLLRSKTYPLEYPLIGGLSDCLIVPKERFSQFSRLCGIFASMNLFVELALPTALAYVCDKVSNSRDAGYKYGYMWDSKEVNDLEEKYHNKIEQLLSDFPEDYAYLHPIKLSRWE